MAAIDTLLQPRTFSRLVSRQMVAEQNILGLFGFQDGGPNEIFDNHGRRGTIDIFDNTREVSEGRVPATAAAVIKPNPVGVITFEYPRMHESVQLSAEFMHNLRQIGSDGARDVNGARMIELQAKYIAQRNANWRATLTVGMLRDSLYMVRVGDSLYPSFANVAGSRRINFRQPADNQSQLDMGTGSNIIDVSWDNTSADIPKHLGEIDAAFQSLYGGGLANVMVKSAMWQNIIKNDAVASQAGIANTPFSTFQREVGTRVDGSPVTMSVGELSCRPGVKFWITDEGVKLGARGSESFVTYVATNTAIFLPRLDQGNFKMMLGSEPISDREGAPMEVRVGRYQWQNPTYNPTSMQVFTLDNCLAMNDIPNSVAVGTVVF